MEAISSFCCTQIPLCLVRLIYFSSLHRRQAQSRLFTNSKNPESLIHNPDLLNLIPCELDLKSTPFSDTPIIKYETELPPSGKKFGFNLMDDEDFTIPYITDASRNSPAGHQLTA